MGRKKYSFFPSFLDSGITRKGFWTRGNRAVSKPSWSKGPIFSPELHCLTAEVGLQALDLPTVIVSSRKTKAAIGLILLYGADLKNRWIHIRIWGLIL